MAAETMAEQKKSFNNWQGGDGRPLFPDSSLVEGLAFDEPPTEMDAGKAQNASVARAEGGCNESFASSGSDIVPNWSFLHREYKEKFKGQVEQVSSVLDGLSEDLPKMLQSKVYSLAAHMKKVAPWELGRAVGLIQDAAAEINEEIGMGDCFQTMLRCVETVNELAKRAPVAQVEEQPGNTKGPPVHWVEIPIQAVEAELDADSPENKKCHEKTANWRQSGMEHSRLLRLGQLHSHRARGIGLDQSNLSDLSEEGDGDIHGTCAEGDGGADAETEIFVSEPMPGAFQLAEEAEWNQLPVSMEDFQEKICDVAEEIENIADFLESRTSSGRLSEDVFDRCTQFRSLSEQIVAANPWEIKHHEETIARLRIAYSKMDNSAEVVQKLFQCQFRLRKLYDGYRCEWAAGRSKNRKYV